MTANQRQGYRTAAYLAGDIIAREGPIHPEYEALQVRDDYVASALLEILTVFNAFNMAALRGELRVCGI